MGCFWRKLKGAPSPDPVGFRRLEVWGPRPPLLFF